MSCSIRSGGAATNPILSPGASTFDSVPTYATTPARSMLAIGRTGLPL